MPTKTKNRREHYHMHPVLGQRPAGCSTRNTCCIYLAIHLLLLFWAVALALQVPAGPERTEHVLFSIIFAPLYILSHYLGKLRK